MSVLTARGRRIAADILREELQMDGSPPSALDDIFEREPLPLPRFTTEVLQFKQLSAIQFDFLHHLERIFLPETYIAMVEEWGEDWVPAPEVHMMTLMWGKGSGKDSMCRNGVTRAVDLLTSLKSPQDYFDLPPYEDIHVLNVASSSDQARKAFFAPMRRSFAENPYLSELLRGDPPSELATSIRLKKNIELISGHSDAETQEGLNLIVGIADEISAFRTASELQRAGVAPEGRAKKTAEGIVNMLQTSAESRFAESYKVVRISYPRFKGDAIMQAAAQSKLEQSEAAARGEQSTHYLSGPWATWEVNPRRKKEDFASTYRTSPVMARTMYECDPPDSINRYMTDDFRITEAFSRVIPDPITVEYYWGLPENQMENLLAPDERPGWQVRFHFNDQVLRPMAGVRYAIHGDLAITGDRAGVAMSHIRTHKTFQSDPNLPADRRPIVRNDFVFSFEAAMSARSPDGIEAPREVQLRWYRQLVWELRSRRFLIGSVTFDGFQSADLIQHFKARGIESKVFSLDRKPEGYDTFKDTVMDGRFEGYFRPRPIQEVKSLTKLANGKIDHPANGSKDEADALAGSVFGALLLGGSEGESPEEVTDSGNFSMSVSASPGGLNGFGGDGGLSLDGFGGGGQGLGFG